MRRAKGTEERFNKICTITQERMKQLETLLTSTRTYCIDYNDEWRAVLW
jgi:hypothetical protein